MRLLFTVAHRSQVHKRDKTPEKIRACKKKGERERKSLKKAQL